VREVLVDEAAAAVATADTLATLTADAERCWLRVCTGIIYVTVNEIRIIVYVVGACLNHLVEAFRNADGRVRHCQR